MRKIHRFLTEKGIYDRARSSVTILGIIGLCFISFEVGSLIEKSNLPLSGGPAVQLKSSEGDVEGTSETQLIIEPEPSSTNTINYVYLADYSHLINSLKREKQYIETYRGMSWYEAERTKIEEEHSNRNQSLFGYYIDIINHYEFLISQCGDCSEAAVYKQKAQEAADEFDVKRQQEELRYQQELAALESQWNSFQARLQTVQKLIGQIEAGQEPDDAFWSLYYQFP